MPANLQKIENENIALQISKWLSRYFVRMAKADILDYSIYAETSTAAISVSYKYPDATLIFLKAFEEVGKILKSNPDFQNRDDLIRILEEMYYKIDNIDSVCQTGSNQPHTIKAKVSRVARKIKKQIKI